MNCARDMTFWSLQGPGWLLPVYLLIAQAPAAFSYELGVAMGTQEPAGMISEVGTAFWHGFAIADTLIYIPLLFLGLIGHLRDRPGARVALSAALCISVYLPLGCLSAMVCARDAAGWDLIGEGPYWIVCLTIAAWGIWGLWVLLRPTDSEGSGVPTPCDGRREIRAGNRGYRHTHHGAVDSAP